MLYPDEEIVKCKDGTLNRCSCGKMPTVRWVVLGVYLDKYGYDVDWGGSVECTCGKEAVDWSVDGAIRDWNCGNFSKKYDSLVSRRDYARKKRKI